MVLLVQNFAKLNFKLENRRHHHHHHNPSQIEDSSSSLHAFQSQVSTLINQLVLDLKPPGSEILSLSWFHKCFSLLPMINKAFAKLVVDIDYPMSKWKACSVEGYLNYSLSFLELLNSISSCVSHLRHAKLSLAHGLKLLEKENSSPHLATKHLKAIQFQFSNKFSKEFHVEDGDKGMIFSDKERIVNEAMKEMKRIGLWVCGVLLSCLYGNAKPYMEMKKISGGFHGSSCSVAVLDLKICEELMGKMPILSEVKDVNDAVAEILVDSDEERHNSIKELEKKVNVLEKLIDEISKEVDNLFADLITQRSELVDGFRQLKQPPKYIV